MQIKTIDLDRDIFSSALFESLTDRGETISLEPIGRKNPFASLSDTSVNFNSDASSFVEEEGDGLNASTTVEDDPALPGSGGGDSLDEDLPPSQLNFN